MPAKKIKRLNGLAAWQNPFSKGYGRDGPKMVILRYLYDNKSLTP
jgi:hypothetical protein